MRCLSEYANVRMTFFTDKGTKNEFVKNFISNIV